MNIALMTNNYKPFIGGVPISVERLAKGLRAQGHQVTIFAPSYQGYHDPEGEQIVRYSSFLQKFIGGIVMPNPFDPVIEAEFQKQDFDVIHVHHPMLIGRMAVYLSHKYGLPLVFTYHTRYEQYVKAYAGWLPWADKFMPFYLHTFMKHCHRIIAPTAGMKEYLGKLGYEEETITILPTGIDADHFQVTKEQCETIRCRYKASGIPLFVSVSRMSNEKNIPFLLRSVAAFKKKYGQPFRLLMVGDGPQLSEYQKLCRQLSVEEEVVFTGKVANEEIAPFYAAVDAFLFASKTETQGIVILEAFAGATPVIAVDATGVRDLVKHGENGFLVKEEEQVFAETILHTIATPDLLTVLSQNAVQSAAGYHEEAVARKAASLYNKVIAAHGLQNGKLTRKERALQWNGNIIF